MQQLRTKAAASNTSSRERQRLVESQGSKLAAVVETLQSIRQGDPTAKALIFVQWSCLKERVRAALGFAGVPVCVLRGDVATRDATIARFRSDPSLWTMLLSLDEAASGTNLTMASHVLLVHPMNASSMERACAFELQAIGRVRRWGQISPVVHVWRFFTLQTIEEELTRKHQAELWRRWEEASQLVSSGSASSSSGQRQVNPGDL